MKLNEFILAFALTLTFTLPGKSQCLSDNLIKNPNLEEYTCCPTDAGRIECAKNWTQPLPLAGSSSEYLNICGIDSITDQSLLALFQHADFGNGYAGIRTYIYDNNLPTREYLQGALNEPLIAKQCYHCAFWVKLFNFKNTTPFVAIDALSIYFSDTLPKTPSTLETAMYFPAQVNNQIGRIITDTTNWTLIFGNFIASGGEQFFTVGTFAQESDINKIYFGSPQEDLSYYFFDNFSLCPCSDTMPPPEQQNVAYIPNVFSPNGDGANDFFLVKGQNIAQVSIKVYNRWGNLVFEGQEAAPAWDGRWQGQESPVGVYYYTAEIIYQNGAAEQKHGNVTIVR